MRALRALGIAENGSHLVCGDAEGGSETFCLPLDEQLRAAVRGDRSRFGQLEIDMQSQLRPREIQSRIRAGATVEQVAAAAGCPPDRIEHYAYPILMERATIAERARRTRPLQGAAIGSAGAASVGRTLEDIVTATLARRGQQQQPVWDALRDERGWTVTATWRVGRSDNRAEWAYRAGPDGGSVTARNEAAVDLVEPEHRPLRTIGDAHPAQRPTRIDRTAAERLVTDTVTDERSGAMPPTEATAGIGQQDAYEATPVARTGTGGAAPSPASPTVLPDDAQRGQQPGGRRESQRGHRPPMPSWEDVLLGTRASGR